MRVSENVAFSFFHPVSDKDSLLSKTGAFSLFAPSSSGKRFSSYVLNLSETVFGHCKKTPAKLVVFNY